MTHVSGFPNFGHEGPSQGGQDTDSAISGAIGEIILGILGGGSGGGLTAEERERLQRQELLGDIILKTTQGAPSISSSTTQVFQDPAQLALIAQNQANEHFIDLQNLDVARDQARVAEEQGNQRIAIQRGQLAEQIQARIENRELQMAQMRQAAQQFAQNMAFQEQQAEFSRAFRIMELTENARQFNAAQRQQLMGQIAELSARPGDVVRAEALKQQAGGQAPISQAIAGGQSAITEDSLSQLQGLLDLRDQLSGGGVQSPRPTGPFETEDRFGFGGLPIGSPEEAAAREQSIFNSTQGQLRAILTGNPSTIAEGTPVFDRLAEAANTPGSAIRLDDRTFSRAEHGGAFTGPVVTGDSSDGKENQEAVFSASPIIVVPIQNDSMKAERAQTGGVFSGSDPNAGARRFLADALSRLFERFSSSGLQLGDRPTPIGVSAPGTSSGLQQIAAATSSAQTGFSPEDFLAEARSLTPTGIRPSIFSRI